MLLLPSASRPELDLQVSSQGSCQEPDNREQTVCKEGFIQCRVLLPVLWSMVCFQEGVVHAGKVSKNLSSNCMTNSSSF